MGTGASAEVGTEAQEPSTYKVGFYVHKPPDRITHRVPVPNMAHPSPARVTKFANIEQQRWGGPSILGRLSCESGLNWAATNGQYGGLAQIGPWWWYAYPQTPRRVRWNTVKHKRKPVARFTFFSDGTRKREVIARKHVRVKIAHRDRLPGDATPYHGLAAIRVTQRAASGDGPTTYWACGL